MDPRRRRRGSVSSEGGASTLALSDENDQYANQRGGGGSSTAASTTATTVDNPTSPVSAGSFAFPPASLASALAPLMQQHTPMFVYPCLRLTSQASGATVERVAYLTTKGCLLVLTKDGGRGKRVEDLSDPSLVSKVIVSAGGGGGRLSPSSTLLDRSGTNTSRDILIQFKRSKDLAIRFVDDGSKDGGGGGGQASEAFAQFVVLLESIRSGSDPYGGDPLFDMEYQGAPWSLTDPKHLVDSFKGHGSSAEDASKKTDNAKKKGTNEAQSQEEENNNVPPRSPSILTSGSMAPGGSSPPPRNPSRRGTSLSGPPSSNHPTAPSSPRNDPDMDDDNVTARARSVRSESASSNSPIGTRGASAPSVSFLDPLGLGMQSLTAMKHLEDIRASRELQSQQKARRRRLRNNSAINLNDLRLDGDDEGLHYNDDSDRRSVTTASDILEVYSNAERFLLEMDNHEIQTEIAWLSHETQRRLREEQRERKRAEAKAKQEAAAVQQLHTLLLRICRKQAHRQQQRAEWAREKQLSTALKMQRLYRRPEELFLTGGTYDTMSRTSEDLLGSPRRPYKDEIIMSRHDRIQSVIDAGSNTYDPLALFSSPVVTMKSAVLSPRSDMDDALSRITASEARHVNRNAIDDDDLLSTVSSQWIHAPKRYGPRQAILAGSNGRLTSLGQPLYRRYDAKISDLL